VVRRAAKILTLANKSNSNRLYFVLPRSEKLWNLPTKTTQLYDILFCHAAQRKTVELRTNALYFVSPRSENLLNCEQKPCLFNSFKLF
jgi:hypothetical protein